MKRSKADKLREAIAIGLEAAKAADIETRRVWRRDPLRLEAHEQLTVYLVGDPHIGMLAQGAETGAGKAGNYDLAIAEATHEWALGNLLGRTDPNSAALFVSLGDACHVDSHANETPRSGHQLDVDARFPVVLETLFRIENNMLRAVAEHHGAERTGAIVVAGNHCASVETALRCYLADMNRDIAVSRSQAPYVAKRFGVNFLGFCHGHLAKPSLMPSIFAHDHAEAWGSTEQRRIYHGHVHSRNVVEAKGCQIESFPTLAPNDQYAADGGWRSERAMTAVVLHQHLGETHRFRASLTNQAAEAIVKSCGDQSRRK